MTQEEKDKIDAMSYEQMLTAWRFSELGDPRFIGEFAVYYADVMINKRNELTSLEAAEISKSVGWIKI